MKELSIEEKAKRYDETKYIMKEYIESGNAGVIAENTIKKAFPELSESEDERIRKELIEFLVRKRAISNDLEGVNISKTLSWLEKQAEQKSIDNLIPQEAMDIAVAKCFNEQKPVEVRTTGYWNVQDIEIPFGAKDSELQEASYHIPEGFHAEIKGNRVVIKRGKQKTKFKVGDWIVFIGFTLLVNEVVQGCYRTISIGGISNSYDWDIDNVARLWTIQDANDGDVLVDSLGNVCIYQEPSTKLMYHSYCYGNHKCFIDMGGSHEIVGSSPATKEQRSLVFQKMKEKGYVFDFENKQLKKIEQKPQCIVSAEAKEAMYEKTAWSKEDENIIEWLIGYLEYQIMNATITEEKDNCLDAISMLKSLKERVQSQPKQEWSEKDNQYLCGLIGLIEQSKAELLITLKGKAADNCIDWLKFLRPHSQWKPSDEQMGVIEAVINNRSFQRRHLDSLYEQLKKLREE